MGQSKNSRVIATFDYPLKIEVRQAPFKWLNSVRHLDVKWLEKAASAEIEVGEVESDCCQHLVRAVVSKGMVTGLRLQPGAKKSATPGIRDFDRLLKQVLRKVRAKTKGPKYPMPIAKFLGLEATPYDMKSLSCIQICLWEMCWTCCIVETIDGPQTVCGKVSIDTTPGRLPYPPE